MTQEAKEQITKLIMESYDKGVADTKQAAIEAIELAIKLEREACANLVENLPPVGVYRQLERATFKDAATAIRARGEA
jgi:hypothetical protein